MTSIIDVKVPDIGDFKDVPIIEISVKPGDIVKLDDPLITLESDKASMEVPSPSAGTIKEILVKIGDRVGKDFLFARLESGEEASPAQAAPAVMQQQEEPEPQECGVVTRGSQVRWSGNTGLFRCTCQSRRSSHGA